MFAQEDMFGHLYRPSILTVRYAFFIRPAKDDDDDGDDAYDRLIYYHQSGRQAGKHSASVDPCLATGLPSKKLNFKSFSLARLKILRPKYACALTDRTGSLAAGAIKSGRKDI